MNDTCGCCEGIQILTPIDVANRPGLPALRYRVGTHASFLETMKARLSNLGIPLGELGIPLSDPADASTLIYPLGGLTTRSADDFSIAMLDAWATLADVLTFYQERIANEGYLRTATERRSVLELARLVGYRLRPGVAASVFLAYTLEKDHNVTIMSGNRAQSVPGPGELPQSFETADTLDARYAWNMLKPRLTRPQYIAQVSTGAGSTSAISTLDPDGVIYFQGAATGMKAGDPLLFVFGTGTGQQVFSRLKTIEAQAAENISKVTLDPPPQTPGASSSAAAKARALLAEEKRSFYQSLVDDLSKRLVQQPRNAQHLVRNVATTFAQKSDLQQQLLIRLNPALQATLYPAIGNVQAELPLPLQSVQAFRVKAAPFGHNAPLPPPQPEIFLLRANSGSGAPETPPAAPAAAPQPDPTSLLALDAEYKDIVTGSWVVIERRGKPPSIHMVTEVQTITLGGPQTGDLAFFTTLGAPTYKTLGSTETIAVAEPVRMKVTVLKLGTPWLTADDLKGDPALVLRTTTVYAQSEPRDLAEAPYGADVGGGTVPETIELDQLYDGLQSGRWAILSGERTDVLDANGQPISGVMASELVMLAGVTQEVQRIPTGQKDQSGTPVMIALPGDKPHTFVHLARPLAYRYERASVTINGNVARATHGETRSEVLGSGDGSKALQQFALRQSPLTFISVPTPAGAESTLQVRVNDLLWHEAESLFGLQPTDRSYTTKTDDTDKTTVIFGNGQYGARLPTGVENVKATYRTGIGKAGNVQAGQITLLATRPLGVKSVNNPLRASGGADKETRDQARRNVPLAFMALDRLVSLRDYADFARTYAGIGKAAVARLSDGRRQLVHLTIAGAENIPIDPTSDLYLNLFQALRQFGDPSEPVQLALAEVMFLIVSAKVRVQPDSLWEAVEARIRAALLDTFSFERRDLGQPVFQSEVLSAIQGVAGVEYVDLEILDAVDQERVIRALDNPQQGGDQSDTLVSSLKLGNGDVPVRLAQVADQSVHGQPKRILPAQLAFLTPDVPDTLILKELTP